MPVLSRAGCNTGACHGYSLGKNGFKLSLRGADPELDYLAITRELARPARQLRWRPEASLLVAKPRGDVAARGRRRASAAAACRTRSSSTGSARARPATWPTPARVVGVRLVPDKLVLRPGQKHRLQLIAEYNDGTHARRHPPGHLHRQQRPLRRRRRRGAGHRRRRGRDGHRRPLRADLRRHQRHRARRPTPSFAPTPVPQDNLIDRHVVEKLNRLKITPSPLAGDEEFLRRVYLDLIGVQPKPDEMRAFLADKDPKKREQGRSTPCSSGRSSSITGR